MIINSPDLLINHSRTPDLKSVEYKPFWENEKNKCKYGIYIDNTYISGFLYWHLNIYKTLLDIDEGSGRIVRKLGNPYLRDNEWLIDSKLQEAANWKNENGEVRKKGLCALGTRRFSKTVIQSSWTRYNASLYEGTQNPIVGGNRDQIKLITDEIDRFDAHVIPPFRLIRIEKDWKVQVAYGKLDTQGNKYPYSYIPTRNIDGGTNTEAAAGLSPQSIIYDEIGTYPFLKALKAALPGLDTPFGWRCVPLCMGTGGDMDSFQDAEELFDHPEAHNFLVCFVPEEERKCGLYLPGWMSYDVPKRKSKLTEYLELDDEKHPNLANQIILVGNKEEGEKIVDRKRLEASKSGDPSALLKTIMYYPKNTREIFLSDSNNNFPIEACKSQQNWIRANYETEYIEFYRDEKNEVKWKPSNLQPISKFPVSPTDIKIAPVSVFEHVQLDAPYASYCIGIDAYNTNESSDRVNSLGTIYVYKRMYDPLGKFQNSIVASYRGRPNEIKTFFQIALDITEYYGAIVLPELHEMLVDFFVGKGKGHYIQNSLQLARDINENTQVKGDKGLSPTTRNQRYYMNLMVQYTKEELVIKSEEGNQSILGVAKILDPMLLQEMIQYKGRKSSSNGIHDGNFDSVVAFGHCLVLAEHLEKYIPLNKWEDPKKKEVKKQIIEVKTFWGNLKPIKKNPFNNTTQKRKYTGFPFI